MRAVRRRITTTSTAVYFKHEAYEARQAIAQRAQLDDARITQGARRRQVVQQRGVARAYLGRAPLQGAVAPRAAAHGLGEARQRRDLRERAPHVAAILDHLDIAERAISQMFVRRIYLTIYQGILWKARRPPEQSGLERALQFCRPFL